MKDFYKVYVISSGCIYEGGGVDGVFVRKDLAEAKFNEMVEEKREHMRAMEEYEKECIESGKHRSFRADGYWLEEKDDSTDKEKCIIFKSEYISMREWECEI